MTDKMHYFRAVEGHAARRFGSEAFIGCSRGPKGFTWNTDVVVAIPETEMLPYRKDYNSYVRHGDLKRATEVEYKAWIDKRNAQGDAVKVKADQRRKDAADAAEKATAKDAKKAPGKKGPAKKATGNNDSGSDDADKSGDPVA